MMDASLVVGGLGAVGLFLYLVVVLLFPERLS